MTPMEEIAGFAEVTVPVEAELDRCILTGRQILGLEPGSVITMKRSAGENITLYVGGARIGYGEMVVAENTLGVRITDFAGPVG